MKFFQLNLKKCSEALLRQDNKKSNKKIVAFVFYKGFLIKKGVSNFQPKPFVR